MADQPNAQPDPADLDPQETREWPSYNLRFWSFEENSWQQSCPSRPPAAC